MYTDSELNVYFLLRFQTCCVGKPYLATTHDAAAAFSASSAAAAVNVPSDWLFQPIAEDEPGFDEETLEAIMGGSGASAGSKEGDTTKVCSAHRCLLARQKIELLCSKYRNLANMKLRFCKTKLIE